jgi:ketosteroid isomerase-like protein
MKTVIPVVAVFLVGCGGPLASGPTEQLGGSPEESLRAWASVLCKGSLADVVGFYDDSEDTLAIQSTGRVQKGITEIRKEYESAFEEVVFERVTLADLTVRQDGDAAWATCRFTARTSRRADKTKWTVEVYTSFVLKRSGKTWRIVLEQSTPIADVPRVRPRE